MHKHYKNINMYNYASLVCGPTYSADPKAKINWKIGPKKINPIANPVDFPNACANFTFIKIDTTKTAIVPTTGITEAKNTKINHGDNPTNLNNVTKL